VKKTYWLITLCTACLVMVAALASAATPSAPQTREELRDLRNRINSLQKKLAASEETRSVASDSLRKSERAISEANRELHILNRRAEESNNKLNELRQAAQDTNTALRAQQELLGQMLREEYLRGKPNALALAFSRDDPNALARQLHYLGHIAQARGKLVESLRGNLNEINRYKTEIAGQVATIANIVKEQTIQKDRLEKEKKSRADVLASLSREIRAQQQEIRAMQANENRLTRLVDQLAKLARKPPVRERNTGRKSESTESPQKAERSTAPLPTGPSNDRSIFGALRGKLGLPVRGQLSGRFGSPRADGGITWKGLFITAKRGEDVRAVAEGRVVYADWLRGFGNLLIIDHGDRYLTLYANAEALLKQVGDNIRSGEPIATVGNSGGNPESGLYFEMRHEGKPFDPLSWMKMR
jgi:septal ring factor EnvC (AmiA/AmiB activator)